MRIRVSMRMILDESWGAEEAWAAGGRRAVLDLVAEDFTGRALLSADAEWLVEVLPDEPERAPR